MSNTNDSIKTMPLGFQARDRITGLEGVAVARTEWLNGCWRLVVQPKTLKDGRPVDPSTFDYQQIEVILATDAPVVVPAKSPGGPMPEPEQMSDAE